MQRIVMTSSKVLVCLILLAVSIWVPGVSAANPGADLAVSFSLQRGEEGDPGRVVGSVSNASGTPYPCVEVELELLTRFDLRPPGEPARVLGALAVEVRDVAPRSQKEFEETLPYPAGARLRNVGACDQGLSMRETSREPAEPKPHNEQIEELKRQEAELEKQLKELEGGEAPRESSSGDRRPSTVNQGSRLERAQSRKGRVTRDTTAQKDAYEKTVRLTAPGSPTSAPVIRSFAVTPIGKDGSGREWAEVSWETEGATEVRLLEDRRPIEGRVELPDGRFGWPPSLESGLRVHYDTEASYVLVAVNSMGSTSRAATAARGPGDATYPPGGVPRIVEFKLSPARIQRGEAVGLYWRVENARRVQLYDDAGELDSRIVLESGELGWPLVMNGAAKESPTRSTTYKLVAIGESGSVTRTFVVEVSGKRID